MPRPRKSTSSLSLSDFMSATDLDVDTTFPPVSLPARRATRDYLPSPLVGPDFELPNRNTIVHATQSSPSLLTLPPEAIPPVTDIHPKQVRKARMKKNTALDGASFDFSQDSISQDGPTIESGSATAKDPVEGPAPKPKRQPRNKKKDEVGNKERAESSNTNPSARGTWKESEMLESMRVIINKTVAEAINSANISVHDDIKSLKTTVNNQLNEMSTMKTGFKNQIQALSEKETRHHLESNVGVKDELVKITHKLNGMNEIRDEMANLSGVLGKRMDDFECQINKQQELMLEKITTIEILEGKHHSEQLEKLTDMELSHRSLASRIKTTEDRCDEWEQKSLRITEKLTSHETKLASINEKFEKLPEMMNNHEEEISKQQAKFDELSSKAEKMMDKMEKAAISTEEFEKVKSTGEQNTGRLDKKEKEEKMMNLLISNLPPNTQSISGFGNFAYHELNVELSQGDIIYIYKAFESTTRTVHLVRFRSLEIRNAVYRGRLNLGYRSRVWINEDLVAAKEALALGARRRFRAGKIARNWTFQGEIYILLKNNPNPIHVACESDFPESTKLEEGEGMIPKELPLRRQRPNFNPYQGPNNTPFRGVTGNQGGPPNPNYNRTGNQGPSQNQGPPPSTVPGNPVGNQGPSQNVGTSMTTAPQNQPATVPNPGQAFNNQGNQPQYQGHQNNYYQQGW